jgi:hypothetical protein
MPIQWRGVKCEGLVKTATISFRQSMPARAMQRAEAAMRAADLVLHEPIGDTFGGAVGVN